MRATDVQRERCVRVRMVGITISSAALPAMPVDDVQYARCREADG
jgi:hypothetical protein